MIFGYFEREHKHGGYRKHLKERITLVHVVNFWYCCNMVPFERLHSFLTWQLTNISDRKLMFGHNLQDLSSTILYTARVKSVVGRLWVADLLLEPSCYWYFVNKIWINLSLVITEKIQIFISDGIEFNFRIITNGDKSILLIQNS